ncbi:MAG: transcriptional regulator [Alphaproteobacteria bacterium]|nr:transcriptional regulator [Alphaproteobacteria bacterium]
MKNHILSRKGDPIKRPYHYKGCGLDNVYLLSGYDPVKDEDGEAVIIHDMDGLHKEIARFLVTEEKTLSGKEIRYLRIFMDLSQSGLGKLLGCDSQSVARYEKEQSLIPSPNDRLLRIIVLGHLYGEVDVQSVVKQIEEMEDRSSKKFRFDSTRSGWKASA